jgi:hypothetical protein
MGESFGGCAVPFWFDPTDEQARVAPEDGEGCAVFLVASTFKFKDRP